MLLPYLSSLSPWALSYQAKGTPRPRAHLPLDCQVCGPYRRSSEHLEWRPCLPHRAVMGIKWIEGLEQGLVHSKNSINVSRSVTIILITFATTITHTPTKKMSGGLLNASTFMPYEEENITQPSPEPHGTNDTHGLGNNTKLLLPISFTGTRRLSQALSPYESSPCTPLSSESSCHWEVSISPPLSMTVFFLHTTAVPRSPSVHPRYAWWSHSDPAPSSQAPSSQWKLSPSTPLESKCCDIPLNILMTVLMLVPFLVFLKQSFRSLSTFVPGSEWLCLETPPAHSQRVGSLSQCVKMSQAHNVGAK